MTLWTSFEFGHPLWLLTFPLIVWWFWKLGREAPTAGLVHSSTRLLASLGVPRRGGPAKILKSLMFLAMILLVLAMARPRIPQGQRSDPNTGVEIVLAVDCSGSMGTEDFQRGAQKISRRDALLDAISSFVDARVNDRIGMVGFAKDTYLLSPMTTDGHWIKEVFKMVVLKQTGTAIGEGIVAAVRLFSGSNAPSKVVILVTDGMNNSGCNPLDAADYAKNAGVRIYTLEILNLKAIKTKNAAASPLAQVAAKTGGQYFQASNSDSLVQIYRQIDAMEKRPFEHNKNMLYDELFQWVLVPAILLILGAWIASRTVWMRLPW